MFRNIPQEHFFAYFSIQPYFSHIFLSDTIYLFLLSPKYVHQDIKINFRREASKFLRYRQETKRSKTAIRASVFDLNVDVRRSGKKFAHIIRAYRTVSRDDWHSARIAARRDRYIQEHTMHVMPATSIRRRNTQPTYHRHVRPSIEYAEVLAPGVPGKPQRASRRDCDEPARHDRRYIPLCEHCRRDFLFTEQRHMTD